MQKTLQRIIEHLEVVRENMDHLENDELEQLQNRLKLLELRSMRLREKRRRQKHD